MPVERVTCTAPVNIAVIKYWGKRDTKLLLPINDSRHTQPLHARTTVAASDDFSADQIWLNGKEEDINNPRLQNVLKAIRARALERNAAHPLKDAHVRICSVNNFPTAAGLASSAAGYACLVYSLAQLFGVADTELTALARVGSGSACRSLMGGFVAWNMGSKADGSDSIATQVVDEKHWPEMEILVLVVNAGKKQVSSTEGMQETVATSPLIKTRAEEVVPARMAAITKAIKERDFATFAKITMQDSNQFHATCLDTYPPIFYMNDTSRAIVQVITKFNEFCGVKAAYTYDAGPNAVLYVQKQDVPAVLAVINEYFPSTETADYIRGRSTQMPPRSAAPAGVFEHINAPVFENSIKYILHTAVGDGPRVLKAETDHLLDASGKPKASS